MRSQRASTGGRNCSVPLAFAILLSAAIPIAGYAAALKDQTVSGISAELADVRGRIQSLEEDMNALRIPKSGEVQYCPNGKCVVDPVRLVDRKTFLLGLPIDGAWRTFEKGTVVSVANGGFLVEFEISWQKTQLFFVRNHPLQEAAVDGDQVGGCFYTLCDRYSYVSAIGAVHTVPTLDYGLVLRGQAAAKVARDWFRKAETRMRNLRAEADALEVRINGMKAREKRDMEERIQRFRSERTAPVQ